MDNWWVYIVEKKWGYMSGLPPIWEIESDNMGNQPLCTTRGPFRKLTPSKERERSKVGAEKRNWS
jgi:hypothetical protein